MICNHRALFRNETMFQICHFFISPHLFNPRIRRQRYNHKDGVGEHNWAPFRRTRNVCRSYVFSSADHSSHILCDADENDFASCLAEMLGWSWYGGGHSAAIAKLRFYSFAHQVGKLGRCTCSLLQLAPCPLYYSNFCYTMAKLIKTHLLFNAVKVAFWTLNGSIQLWMST